MRIIQSIPWRIRYSNLIVAKHPKLITAELREYFLETDVVLFQEVIPDTGTELF